MGFPPLLAYVIVCICFGFTLGVEVSTKYGTVRGQTLELNTGFRVNTFLGIPFAKPPVGPLRWKVPQEPDSWSDTFVANKYGSMCPQSGSLIAITHPDWENYSEDCLHLNVYAPNNSATAGPYPVMVFVHGGGYGAGGSIQYMGHFMAARDVVVVVTNYRLDIFGFMSTGDSTTDRNAGLQDQLQSLRFVKDNIAAFGGDPNKVTLFGQSAGGSSVGLHIMSPKSTGFFHQAICQSGTEMTTWGYASLEQRAERLTRSVAEKLGCNRTSNADMVECMRGVNASTLVDTGPDSVPDGPQLGFSPSVDGEGGFLPDDADVLRAQGKYNKVPLISGITTEDGSLAIPGLIPESIDGGFNRTEYVRLLRELIFGILEGEDEYRTEQVYQAIHHQYTNWPHIDDLEGNRESFVKLATDAAFGLGMDLQVKAHADDSATYMYLFGYRGNDTETFIPKWMGVPHIGDIPYVFGMPQLKDNPAVAQETQIEIPIDFDDVDVAYSEFTITLFTNFAKTGNPTPSPVNEPGSARPITWHRYDNKDLNYLLINKNTTVLNHYRQRNFALWTDYLPWIINHNTTTSKKLQNVLMTEIF